MKRDYGIFHVALKLLLRRGSTFLFLKAPNGQWDLPGGRIDNVEYRTPLKKVLAREIREELGPVKYKLRKALFQYRRIRKRRVPVFLVVYEAVYLSGEIKLSPEHQSYHWINPKRVVFRGKDFCCEEEYRAFQDYFGKN